MFRKFQDTTSSVVEKTKSKTGQIADSTSDKAQTAWEDTQSATKGIASKTKQKTNETLKGAEQSANFLGKTIAKQDYAIQTDWIFHFLLTTKHICSTKAKETSTLGKECNENVEDAIDAISDKTESAWNRTKLAAYDTGEP